MKKQISTLLTASLLASTIGMAPMSDTASVAAASTKSVTDLSKYETNEVIVVYKNDSNATVNRTMRLAGLSKKETEEANGDTLTENSVILRLDSQDTLEDAIDTLSQDSRVAYVQPNYTYYALEDTSSVLTSLQGNPGFSSQWAYYNDGSLNYEEIDYRNSNSGGYYRRPGQGGSSSTSKIQVQATEGVDIDLPEAWAEVSSESGNRETIVAFVDTGIMYDHEDLQENMWINEDEIAGDGIDNDGNGYIDDIYGWNFYGSGSFGWFQEEFGKESGWDDFMDWMNNNGNYNNMTDGNNTYYNANNGAEDSHGTHGAGTVAALNNSTGTVGIAANSNVKLMSVKALGGTYGEGTTESVVKGIQYAIDNGASIINLSLGGEEDDATLRSVIANNPNVLFTIAAGNGDTSYNGVDNDSTPTYPANYNYDNVLSVANLQCDGTLHYSSNYGANTVQLAAPGSSIYSTSTENDSDSSYTYGYGNSKAVSGYETMTGTSMAAPMVSGVAAMLYSKFDKYSILDIKNAILQSVTSLDSLSGKVSTGGTLNAYRAAKLLKDGAITATTPVPSTATATPSPSSTATNTVAPTKTPTAHQPGRVTPTPKVTETPVSSSIPANSASPSVPGTPAPTATAVPGKTTVPTEAERPATYLPTESFSPDTTETPTPALTIDYMAISSEILNVGKTYTLDVPVTGGVGPYTYNFFINHGTKMQTFTNTTGTLSWKPTTSGSYIVWVYVTDSIGTMINDYTILSVEDVKVTSISKNKTMKKGATVKFTAKVNAGIAPITYKFTIYRNGKKVASKSSTKNYISYKIKKTGTYKISVTATDAKGNKASKSITKKVKK